MKIVLGILRIITIPVGVLLFVLGLLEVIGFRTTHCWKLVDDIWTIR